MKAWAKFVAPEGLIYNYDKILQAAGLLDVQTLDSTILVDLKYASKDNFVGKNVYGDLRRAYLQPEVGAKLVKASNLLQQRQPTYRLLVYDAARPRQVQQVLWDTLKMPDKQKIKYVADPALGSIHNYGSAVDLTIAHADGRPLDMGTPFDFFGPLAYPVKEQEMLEEGKLLPHQVQNRVLLRTVMQQAGFTGITSEWWHFNAMSRAQAKQSYRIIE